jgi:Leucine-rich repeat (LRR) protein
MDLMSKLEVLLVGSNKLKAFPESFAFLNLKKFAAPSNQIETLPGSFSSCKALEVLDMEDNPLQFVNFWSLVSEFPKLRELSPRTYGSVGI